MKLSRVLVVSGLLLIVGWFAACGGSGSKPAPPPALAITTSGLPQGTVNVPYSYTLQATGGVGTDTWSISSGALPMGLSLAPSTGAITGAPTTAGTSSFVAQVMDTSGHTATANLSISIEGALLITCDSCAAGTTNLPSGAPGVPYNPSGSPTFSATGGVAPYTWCVVNTTSGVCDPTQSELPPGLMLTTDSNGNGVISGTPSAQPAAPVTFTVQAADSESPEAVGSITVTLPIFSILTKTLPNGIINQAYKAGNGSNVEVIAGGGMGSQQHPYTWCVVEASGACDNGSGGALPAGLSLCTTSASPICAITGTPTQLGLSTFTINVKDGETPPAMASGTLSIDVTDAVLTITTTSFPPGNVNLPYSAVLQATGGNGTNTWCVLEMHGACDDGTHGALPAGLSLNSSTGVLSGTPTMPGTSSFVVQVQDSENPPQIATSGTLSITINAAIGNGTLNGIYVFSFSGYAGQNSSPVVMAGALNADGNGGLTGEFDLNNGAGETNASCSNGQGHGPAPQTLASGSGYSIQSNGLGTMTFVTSAGTYNFTIAIRPDGSGTFIQDNTDPSTRGSGVIVPQAAGVNIGQLQGKLVVGLNGSDDAGSRYAAAGQMIVSDPNGDVGVSTLDVDDAGATSSQTFRGTLSTTVDSFGRGCFGTLNFNGQHDPPCATSGNGPNAYCYAYYLISANQFAMISTDPIGGTNSANLTLWSGVRQIVGASGFNNGNLAVPNLLELSARDTNGSADVTTGLFVGQGTSSHSCPTTDSATFTFDENQGGTGPGQQVQTAPGTYCVDSSTGRVTLTNFSGWTSTPPVLYLGGNEPGFAVGTDAGVTSGAVEVQQVQSGKPFSDASVVGGYWGGTFMPAASIVTDSVTELFADGVGDIIGTQYTSGPGGPGGPNQLTLTYSVDSTGRAVLTQNGNEFGVLYVVGPNKLVLVPSGSSPALNVFLSGQ